MAWALAILPLASAVLLAALVLLEVADGMRALTALTLLASIAFVLADGQRLRRSGVAAGGIPSAWWSLLPPIYLWRRAAALGRSKAPFWAWFASTAAASAVRVAVLVALASQAADERAAAERLPDCADRGMVTDLRAVFDDLPAAKQDGVRAVSLGGQAEVAQGPGPVPTVRTAPGRCWPRTTWTTTSITASSGGRRTSSSAYRSTPVADRDGTGRARPRRACPGTGLMRTSRRRWARPRKT